MKENNIPKKGNLKDLNIDFLKSILEDSIEQEVYEASAKIRDLIKEKEEDLSKKKND